MFGVQECFKNSDCCLLPEISRVADSNYYRYCQVSVVVSVAPLYCLLSFDFLSDLEVPLAPPILLPSVARAVLFLVSLSRRFLLRSTGTFSKLCLLFELQEMSSSTVLQSTPSPFNNDFLEYFGCPVFCIIFFFDRAENIFAGTPLFGELLEWPQRTDSIV